MKKTLRENANWPLFSVSLFLIVWGTVMLATTSFPLALKKFGSSWHYFFHQVLFGLIPGFLIGVLLFKTDLEKLKRLSFYIFGTNLLITLTVFLPGLGAQINGARRWIKIGSFMFQPSEFLKITFLMYLAAWLANKLQDKQIEQSRFKLQPLIVFIVVSLILVLVLLKQPDFSTLFVITLLGFIVYFCSKTLWWHSALAITLGAIGIIVFVTSSPYRFERVKTFLHPQTDPLGRAYQLKESLIAIGSGGIVGIDGGISLGMSRQKFGFLPHAMSDSIFAIVGEELGFVGTASLILSFLALTFFGIKASLNTKNEFYKLLGIGISFWFSLQALFNIGGIIGIMPMAGIPLPFFSYGSSHLISELSGLAILLNISKKAAKTK